VGDTAAIVICPEGFEERTLLGLTLGERLLLSLSYGGVSKVAFVGDGPRPQCARASVQVVTLEELTSLSVETPLVLLASDVVFDRKLLSNPSTIPAGLPLRTVQSAELQSIAEEPTSWLERLGRGSGPAKRFETFALRVVDQTAIPAAESALLNSLRKPIDGFASQHLNRHISLFFTRYLVRTGLQPNTLTVVFFAIGALGAYFAWLAEPWWALVLAGFCFQAQSVLDGCDGEMARLTYRFSHIGQWLDSIGDDLTNYLFCLALALGQARVSGQDWIATLGYITLFAQCFATGLNYRRLIQLKTGDLLAIPDMLSNKNAQPGPFDAVFRVVKAISKRDVFVLIVSVITALQMPLFAFLLFAIGCYPAIVGVVINDIRVGRMLAEKSRQETAA
jgi:phosphatidylglycerophosphate synthase